MMCYRRTDNHTLEDLIVIGVKAWHMARGNDHHNCCIVKVLCLVDETLVKKRLQLQHVAVAD